MLSGADWKQTINNREPHDAPRLSGGHHWEGIYSHFRDVPRFGSGFESSYWVQRSRSRTKATISAASNGTSVQGQHALLPLLISIAGVGSEKLRVLDFGGGMGVSYFHVVQTLPHTDFVDYTIVETGAVCESAKELFPGDSKVHFVSELPGPDMHFDIVHVNSSLQYVEDYAGLI